MMRLGILGTASTARFFFGQRAENCEIVAVASRDRERAHRVADAYGIPNRFGSYDELLADPSIDAVYIPLPHHLHCEYAVRAARCGKHVLVEKPAALCTREIESMLTACREGGVMCMEALMYRFKRIHARVRELVGAGEFGPLQYVDFNWCFPIRLLRRSSFRLDSRLGGGALMDVGVYGVDFLRFLTGAEPVLRSAFIHRDRPEGVDLFAHVVCGLGEVVGTITCGYTADANYYVVAGERGSVIVPGSVSGRMVENTASFHVVDQDSRHEERFPRENPYIKVLEYFAACVARGVAPEPGLENSLHNIGFLEMVFREAVAI